MTKGRKPHRHLTQDEWRLWKAVTREISPLEPDRPQDADAGAAIVTGHAAPKTRTRTNVVAPSGTEPVAIARRGAPTGAPLSDFETRRARRLGSGRLAIEAKLDLHGLRQEEARIELVRFLRQAQASGFKHVKVITGKGGSGADLASRPFSLFEDNRRGVLHDQVPLWLGQRDCRALVVSFTEAGRSHGGTGALYIQIRRKAVS